MPRGVSEARPRLNASGAAFRADAEVWFADDRTVDDYLARFRRNKVSGERPVCPRAPKRASPAHFCACLSGCCTRPRRTLVCRASHRSHLRAIMSDKSPRQHMAKKQGKTIKEKRADKRDKANAAASIDPVSRAAKR